MHDEATPATNGRAAGAPPLLQVLGPGILYAGAAVGVSHLVQATRAGAVYGLGLTLVVLFACVVKYPALRFGGEYAAATGQHLIHNYRRTGWWAIGAYGFAQAMTMAFAIAAVALINVGLLKAVLGLELSDLVVTVALLAVAAAILLTGRYHLLERMTKLIVAAFTVLILATTLLVATRVDWSLGAFVPPAISAATLPFMIALMGFMPSPMDACVIQSLWTAAKSEDSGRQVTPAESRLDFNVGFITSVILAFCFLILGAGVIFGTGVPLEATPAGFANQVIEMFTSAVGDWVRPIISIAAVAVLFSTLVTILDGYPRIVTGLVTAIAPQTDGRIAGLGIYDVTIVGLCLASTLVIGLFMESFTTFIDLSAVLLFLTSPLLAFLNHRAMHSEEVAPEHRPSTPMRIWSIAGIIIMLLLALSYLAMRAQG